MKRIILAFAIGLLTCSCGNKNSFLIDGHLDATNMEGVTVYLLDTERTPVDSAVISGGRFQFKGIADSVAYLILRSDAPDKSQIYYMPMFIEPGKIYADLVADSFSGTPLNDQYYQFLNNPQIVPMQKQLEELENQFYVTEDPAERIRINDEYDTLYNRASRIKERLAKEILAKNPDNLLGALMFYSTLNTREIDKATLEKMLEGQSPAIVNFKPIQTLMAQLNSLDATAVGMKYTDFEGTDFVTGEPSKLSAYVEGKIALVDFWASWCAPCREEIKDNLIDIYAKYGDRITVVGVDVWDKPDKHKEAVEEMGIKYPQLLVADKKATDIYGINGIPHILLIGADGTILARDLRGANIEAAVEKALK